MRALLEECFTTFHEWVELSWRVASSRGRRDCSDSSKSIYSEGTRYMWVWHVYVLEYVAQQIYACSDVHYVCSSAFVDYTDVHTDHICAHVHLPTHVEPSLTLGNLTSVLDSVQDLDYVATWLQIPSSKQDELKQQYDRREVKRGYTVYFVTQHPSPSWMIVALALLVTREHGALEVVQKLYLKGEPYAHSCIQE